MKNPMRNLQVETVPVSDIKPWPANARTHTKKQIGQIADSMRQFGWTFPILVDGSNGIIAGHGRLEAAKLIGFDTVPILRIEDMSEAEIRAYRLADNKLAENASWDEELLKLEFQELIRLEPGFELTTTGFEMAEIDVVLGDTEPEPDPALETAKSDLDGPRIASRGDLWLLGDRHRLFCGDALADESYLILLDGEKARLGLSDPPYNVKIAGNVSGLGRKKHKEFGMASGEMSESEFTRFLESSFSCMAANSVDGAIQFIFMDWRHVVEVTQAGLSAFGELKNICVWDKKNGGMGSFYRSAHEFVFVFKSGDASHVNNVELGRFGRNRTNVWRYAGASSFGRGRGKALDMHPTVKPVAMLADAMLDCSNLKDVVLDPFGGSGSTIIAAERTGRRARMIELDPKYVDVALRRWRRVTGIDPVHADSGRSVGELERDRDYVFERAMA